MTELFGARDASCPNGKKMGERFRKIRISRRKTMNGRHLFLTSSGLNDKMKKKFFDIIGKCPKDVKVLYIPTAGI